MAAPFVGNQDYRGYLNYLGTQGDKSAAALLNYVGNDAKFGGDRGKVGSNQILGPDVRAHNASYYDQYQRLTNPATLNSQPQNLIGGGYTPPAKAATYDVTGGFKSAYNQAAQNQNPLYDKYLNQFVAEQANKTAAQQNLYNTTNANYDTALKNTQEANALTGQRTAQDVATNQAQIATNQDQFQADTGTKFAIDRIQQARDQAASGGTGGLAAQKSEGNQTARNTAEGRQIQQYDSQKQAQELVKARTFEDLATSSRLAADKTNTGKKNAQFDLDNYLEASKINLEQFKTSNEANRASAILGDQNTIARTNYENYLNSISNPATQLATAQRYSGSF